MNDCVQGKKLCYCQHCTFGSVHNVVQPLCCGHVYSVQLADVRGIVNSTEFDAELVVVALFRT